MGREGHLRTFPRPSQRGPVLVPLSPVVLKIPEASAQPAVWWVRLVVLAPLAARRWVLASWIPVHWVPWSQTLLFPSSLSWTLHFQPGPGCSVQRCFLKAPRGWSPVWLLSPLSLCCGADPRSGWKLTLAFAKYDTSSIRWGDRAFWATGLSHFWTGDYPTSLVSPPLC